MLNANVMMDGFTSILAMNLSELGSNLWSFLLLALGFSLVIFVHELGHFLAAKWAGVRVERFAIGFGKELLGFTKGETRYSLNVLPLGGYVKMLGQEDFVVDKSGELKVKADPRSFTNKSIGKRMVIISAGVIMNLIFAAIAFGVVVMYGRLQPPAVVGGVVENSPAGRAGLQVGDRIVAVNGKNVETFEEFSWSVILSDVEEPLVLDVQRDHKPLLPKPEVKPEFKNDQSVRQVGIMNPRNRRVMLPSLWPKENPKADDLQNNDELYKLVLDGEAKEFKDIGVFHRALVEARGGPVRVIVKRPRKPEDLPQEAFLGLDPQIEADEVPVTIRAVWTPLSCEQSDVVTGNLLGLVPRLTVLFPDKDRSFDLAGAATGDVITRIGSNYYPNYETVKRAIEENAGREVALEVRRPFAPNKGFSADAVTLLCEHREALIAAARTGTDKSAAMLKQLAASAQLDEKDLKRIDDEVGKLEDAQAWRRWLETVDVHALKPLVPKAPFALVGKTPPPPIDTTLRSLDEDHLVVADVEEKLGDRVSPAKEAGIPTGAVLLAIDGKPVKRWYELCEKFRAAAGQSVDLRYRVADEEHTARMAIPACITSALDIPAGSRIAKIDGKSSCNVPDRTGKSSEVVLPDWRAVREMLKNSVGKTVPVEYTTIQGEQRKGTYAVKADNYDPWLQRVFYAESFLCYPLVERHPISNPLVAVGVGFKQAYQATMQTILSIKHMVFTRQVGIGKVSGPVGIFRVGTKFADSGMLNLIWFLAVISANLAVINFLPMPIVDGGLFLFLILEKIRGEPVSIRTQVATQLIGLALIATLFILVTYQDIRNWITGT